MRSIYSPRQIQVATFLGGPLAAAYFLKKGFESINQEDLAKKSFYISILVSIFLLLILPFLPENIPNNLITLMYFIPVVILLKNKYLTKEEIIESQEYRFESSWKVFGLSIAFIFAFMILAMGVLWTVQSDGDIAQQVTNDLNKSSLELHPTLVEFKASKDKNGSGVILDFMINQHNINDYRNTDIEIIKSMVIQFLGRDALKDLAESNIYFITNFNSPAGKLIKKVIISPSNIDSI